MNRTPVEWFIENNNVKILSALEIKEPLVKDRMNELNLGYAVVDSKGTYWLFDDFDDIRTMANEGCLMESIESLAVESIDSFQIEFQKKFGVFGSSPRMTYDEYHNRLSQMIDFAEENHNVWNTNK